MSSNSSESRSNRSGGIDPAALAGAAIAGALSVFAPPGPWDPGGIIVGVTILLLIWGYDVDPHRDFPQSLAFAAVFAFVCILPLGYPLEILFADNPREVLSAFYKERSGESAVPKWALLALWIALTGALLWYDRRRYNHKH